MRTAVNSTENGIYSPEQEDYRYEIWKYDLGKNNASDKHESDEEVDDTSCEPPSPPFGTIIVGGNAELHDSGKYEKPAENLRRNGISYSRPKKITETTYDHEYAGNKNNPPILGLTKIVQ